MPNPATPPDLTTPAQVLGYFADGGASLTPAQTAALPDLVAGASAAVRAYCKRLFTIWTFDERYTVGPPSREITLKHFPVVSVDTVATGPAEVLTVGAGPSAQRATVALTTTGSAALGFAVTGLTLTSWSSGVKSVRSVAIDGTTPTLAALATAIGGGPWAASVAPGFESWPAAELAGPFGSRPAAGGKAAGLVVFADEPDYHLEPGKGFLTLGPEGGADTSSPRWGPAWGGDGDDVAGYGGTGGVRVVYTAGFDAAPADVVQVVAELVKLSAERFGRDTSVTSESDGVLSWSAGELQTIPPDLARRLNPYVNHRG